MSGRIKLHRKVIDNPISNNIELLWLFSYLLLKANHQQNTFFVWSQKITVVPWQFVWSQMKIADHFWLSRNKIIRYLKVLEDEKIVNIKWYTKYSLFTIVNRQSYQDTEHQIDNKWTSNEHQIDTNKKEKKEKNVNNDTKVNNNIFKKPTTEAIKEYCKERNNQIDAQRFINYYDSIWWMVWKNKMKDWKATIRWWESRDKEKKTWWRKLPNINDIDTF